MNELTTLKDWEWRENIRAARKKLDSIKMPEERLVWYEGELYKMKKIPNWKNN